MPVPRWRSVRYTDDGCYLFQCLTCYKMWEGRTEPGYTCDGVYHADWKHCPYCGVVWTHKQPGYDDRSLGTRRQRILEAQERRGCYWHESPPVFWWLLQEGFENPANNTRIWWRTRYRIRAFQLSTPVILEKYKRLQGQSEEHTRIIIAPPSKVGFDGLELTA